MKRLIFVGSSAEAFDKAQDVKDLLSKFEDTEGLLWNDVFEPGYLNFEALQDVFRRCCAAVFIATPDVDGTSRDRKIKLPRSNVILEFGLMAGRLGLHNIALCRYGSAELPSDLEGLTVIDMDCSDPQAAGTLPQDPRKKLQIWASRLTATPDTIPRTAVVHGYSGRWRYELKLNKWWDIQILPPNFVHIAGTLDLSIHAGGHIGSGLAQGRLYFKLAGKEPWAESIYEGEYRVATRVTSALCEADGSLKLTSQMFALQKMNSVGKPPDQLVAMDALPEPWSSQWALHPTLEPGSLQGSICTEGTGKTEGTATITKEQDT